MQIIKLWASAALFVAFGAALWDTDTLISMNNGALVVSVLCFGAVIIGARQRVAGSMFSCAVLFAGMAILSVKNVQRFSADHWRVPVLVAALAVSTIAVGVAALLGRKPSRVVG